MPIICILIVFFTLEKVKHKTVYIKRDKNYINY